MMPGDWVRTTEPLMGFAQGPSAAHGDGAPQEIPAGGLCELFSIDATTGWGFCQINCVWGWGDRPGLK